VADRGDHDPQGSRGKGSGSADPADVTERWGADPSHVRRAAERLREGAVIAFPTDTLYAVGARARDPVAVRRLYDIKRRPAAQPMVWLVTGAEQAAAVAEISNSAAELMRRFWPGPLTLVLPAKDGDQAPTIAVRAPNHEVALALLRSLGEPIASSSANRAGEPPPVDADQVLKRLGGAIDLIVDGGACDIGQPSTILDMSGDAPRILRQGAIPAASLIVSRPG
jgi:L-threonylcarbamoyladenylate synthase